MIEIRHLRLLQELAASGSVTVAADRLHLSQSAISHQLKALEEALGITLVERATRPVQITSAGKCLLDLARKTLPDVEATLQDIAKIKGGEAGQLRIAVECHTCYDWLMPAMDIYRAAWPKIELDLVGGFHPDPLDLLTDGQADLIVTSDAEPRAGVTHTALFSYEIVALLSQSDPLSSKKYLVASDFATQPLISYPVPDNRLDLIRRVLAPAGIKPVRRNAELTIAILQMVASNRGIAALPAWACAPYVERGYVVSRPINAKGLWGELYASVRERDAEKAFVQNFVSVMTKESFAQLPGIRSGNPA
ncbi:MAG TPA: LysR family transcriptional regulator [Gallionella sp.]|nr:LysR family transcriptional regulator [Gallionella sp.]